MRPSSLREKLLEIYVEQNIDTNEKCDMEAVKRCVMNYLRKKYDDKKIQRIIDDINSKHDLLNESKELKKKIQLSRYIDSIVLSRIRDSYKSSELLDIDSLNPVKFKALVKQIVVHFGYDILFVPLYNLNNIDIIIHRKDIKIAVLAIKSEPGNLIGLKTIRQLRYIANYYHCEQGLIITNSYFDPEAINEAPNISITLIDRDKLIPLVQDLVNGRQEKDREYLIDAKNEQKSSIFLEGEIKFPKTKVQVVYVKYYIDSNTNYLTFEGKLFNSGKRAASNISVDVKLFNRNNDCIYMKNFPIQKEKLESKEEVPFKFHFDEIPQHDWENLCRYQLKLEYKNTYKE